MPGLIQSNINTQNPTVAGYDPERVTIDPTKETIEGRVQRLIAQDSPLMQQAATRAKQQVAQRGLLNTSIGVGAGQQALYNTAVPIASQDAQTYFQSSLANQAAGNQALSQRAASVTQAGLQERAGQIDIGRIGAELEAQSRLQAEQGEITKSLQAAQQAAQQAGEIDLQQLRGDQAQALSEIENQYATLRQTIEGASLQFSNASLAISQILANPDIEVGQKQALIDKQIQLLNAGMRVTGALGDVDLSGILGLGGTGGTPGGEEPGAQAPGSGTPGGGLGEPLTQEQYQTEKSRLQSIIDGASLADMFRNRMVGDTGVRYRDAVKMLEDLETRWSTQNISLP